MIRQGSRAALVSLGLLVLIGSFRLNYEKAAELINFGAFLAFLGVNAAAFHYYYVPRTRPPVFVSVTVLSASAV